MGNAYLEETMQTIECPYCAAEIPAHVKKCKHCSEWVKKPEVQSSGDERVPCGSCGKKMIPRILTSRTHSGEIVPDKSLCPFCGATHKEFEIKSDNRASIAIAIVIFVLFIYYFINFWHPHL